MDWHIITSSKGGIGKTLLTLLLLAYHLENKREGSTLVLDLNGMNTDSASLLLYRKRRGKPVFLKKHKNEKDEEFYCVDTQKSEANGLEIYRTYSMSGNENSEEKEISYAVGYPLNPYNLHDPQSFAQLLIGIKAQVNQIQTELELKEPFKHILIDTNYHFRNLFSSDESDYTAYQADGPLQTENIFVWFLWVYRQLEKLTAERESQEAKIVESTAKTMEACLNNHDCQAGEQLTPFKHVLSPAALVASRTKDGSLTGSLKDLFNAITNQRDYIVPELYKLSRLPKGDCISFNKLVENLNTAYNAIDNKNMLEPAFLLLPILEGAVKQLTGLQYCPANLLPLPIYHADLRQYTDRDRGDIVKTLKAMKIYHRYFSSWMEK